MTLNITEIVNEALASMASSPLLTPLALERLIQYNLSLLLAMKKMVVKTPWIKPGCFNNVAENDVAGEFRYFSL